VFLHNYKAITRSASMNFPKHTLLFNYLHINNANVTTTWNC